MSMESKGREYKKKKRTFIRSFKDCLRGLDFIFIHEDNFKREFILGIIALILCVILKVSRIEFIIVLIVIGLVLFAESVNTTIEKAIDLYTKEYNKEAGMVKDIAAGSVIIICFFAMIIGMIIFVPKIIVLLGGK